MFEKTPATSAGALIPPSEIQAEVLVLPIPLGSCSPTGRSWFYRCGKNSSMLMQSSFQGRCSEVSMWIETSGTTPGSPGGPF